MNFNKVMNHSQLNSGDSVPAQPGEIDLGLFVVVITLCAFGILMIFSSSYYAGTKVQNNSFYYFLKQLRSLGVGLMFLTLSVNINYKIYARFSAILMILALILVAGVFIPGMGITLNGATRWMRYPFAFQPSEFAKIALIVYLADYLCRKQDKIQQFSKTVLPVIILLSFLMLLIIKQPNMSTAILIAVIGFSMLFLSGASVIQLFGLSFSGLIATLILIFESDYRWRRVSAFVNPWLDKEGSGYNIIQSLIAVSYGGFGGVGFGNSIQKYSYLPMQYTDFIYAIICEELGFIGGVVMIGLFGILIYRGMKIAHSARDLFGYLLASGIVVMIASQVVVNIGVVLNVIPSTGLTLPFISYGGSSLIMNLFSIGILLNISKYKLVPVMKTEITPEDK